jgi:lactate dehydrogenase-like 2-hydroxyacid dehydrogenase
MAVNFADHKNLPPSQIRPGKVPFTEVLQTSTLIFLTLHLTPSTNNLLSTVEFALMRPDALLVNVARGGIVDEEVLVKALEEKQISGAATDVFLEEPAGVANSVLVRKAREWNLAIEEGGKGRGLNGRLVLSPHIAWWARSSIEKLRATVAGNIEGWAKGKVQNVVA